MKLIVALLFTLQPLLSAERDVLAPDQSFGSSSPIRSSEQISIDLNQNTYFYLTSRGLSKSGKHQGTENDELGLAPLTRSKELGSVAEIFRPEAKYTNPERSCIISCSEEHSVLGIYTYDPEKKFGRWRDVGDVSVFPRGPQTRKNGLSEFSKIKILDLVGANIERESLNDLLNVCPNLEVLALPYVGVKDGLGQISYPKTLKKLIIYNSFIGEPEIKSIGQNKSIKDVVLYGCSIGLDPKGLDFSPFQNKIELLELSHCSFGLMTQLMRKGVWLRLKGLSIDSPYDWVAFDLVLSESRKVAAVHSKYAQFPVLERVSLARQKRVHQGDEESALLVSSGFLGSKVNVMVHVIERPKE